MSSPLTLAADAPSTAVEALPPSAVLALGGDPPFPFGGLLTLAADPVVFEATLTYANRIRTQMVG